MKFDEFVLAASTVTLSQERVAREHADAVEFRMDLANNPVATLQTYSGRLPVIATNRVESEGGQARDRPRRLDHLETAAKQPRVEAIDVELATVERGDADNLLAVAAKNDTAVIVSVHDFDGTPARSRLEELLTTAADYGDVGKVAVTATDTADTLDLLAATRAATAAGHTVATMAMGGVGRHTRVVAPLYGSRIGYAPIDPAEATAPGQYPLATLADLVARLQ